MVFVIEKPERRKPIRSWGRKYSVGSNGNVYNRQGEWLKAVDGKWVNLCQDGEVERVSIAYLVARAFVPNSEGRPWVRHKDGNVRNNRAENLEWSEVKEDLRGRRGRYCERRVAMFDRGGAMVRVFSTTVEASAAVGVNVRSIRAVCQGDRKTAGGFIWRWVE